VTSGTEPALRRCHRRAHVRRGHMMRIYLGVVVMIISLLSAYVALAHLTV